MAELQQGLPSSQNIDSSKKVTLCQKCCHVIKSLTVEPIAIYVFLAVQIYFVVLQTGLYQVVCYQLYNEGHERHHKVDCMNAKLLTLAEQNHIQQEMAEWSILLAVSHFLSGMISTCLLGAWGDINGRKANFLLGITGMLISIFPTIILFEYKSMSLWIMVIVNFLSGFTGFIGIIMLSAFAYLCDTVPDKKERTVRLTAFSSCMSMAGILGSLASGVLLTRVSLANISVLVEILFAAGFFYSLLRLENITPAALREKVSSQVSLASMATTSTVSGITPMEKTEVNNNPLGTKISQQNSTLIVPSGATATSSTPMNKKKKVEMTCKQKCSFITRETKDLFKNIILTYTKKRPDYDRAFILMTSLIMFLHMMADLGLTNSIMGQYVFRHPFYWTDGSQLGYWKSAKGIMNFVGNMCGILLLKGLLKMSDTYIMLVSTVSGVAELIIIGLSTEAWMLYAAVACGSLSNLIMPVVGSFVSQIVEGDEIGKSFTVHGIAAGLSFMISAAVFNAVYKLTLDVLPGFVFLFGAGILSICFVLILWIHLMDRRCRRMRKKSATDAPNVTVQRASIYEMSLNSSGAM